MPDADPRFTVTDAWSLVEEVRSLDYFHPHPALPEGDDIALPCKVIRGGKDTRVIALVGANATGKSFWRRLASAVCSLCDPKIEGIRTSMEDRSANSPLYGPARALIYGTEEWQSTGDISAHTVHAGLNTCMGRTTPNIFVLDEPDLGCSEEVALGIGQEIAARVPELPATTRAVVVITHSRVLLAELMQFDPHTVWMGADAGASLHDWVTRQVVPLTPEALGERAIATFRRVTKVKKYTGAAD